MTVRRAATKAAEILEAVAYTFNCLIAKGRMHVLEVVSGSLRVCKGSLFVQ